MNLNAAKNLIKNLLESVNVESVYYIDDYLSFDGLTAIERYISNTDSDVISKHTTLIPDDLLQIKDENPDAIEYNIQQWWQTLSNEERNSVLQVCHPYNSPNKEYTIQSLMGDICILCSPQEWVKKYSGECLERIKHGKKSLLLFDQKLGDTTFSEGESRTGTLLAQNFSNNDGVKENTYCGIFSQSFDIENEFQFRNDNLENLSSWAFPFSKKRVPDNEDYSLFIEGLNNLLWVGFVDKLVTVTKEVIQSTSKTMYEEFGKILPLEFKQVIIDSSSAEGCREIDTLIRLLHIIFGRELQRALSNNASNLDLINNTCKSIKQIDGVTAKTLRKELGRRYDKVVVNSLFQDENFIPKEVVNSLLLPLQNGDVFCVNENDYYVLLCQPCNIAIRTNGTRSTDIGYFVPLDEYVSEDSLINQLDTLLSIEDREKRKQSIEEYKNKLQTKIQRAAQGLSYPVKCSIEGKSRYAILNKNITISLSILDYCTFSEDGQVIVNKECSQYLHDNQKLLYNNHTKNFCKILDLNNLVKDLGEDCQAIVRHKVENWFYSFLTKLGLASRFENNRYYFPIVRIGHIQEPLASDILTRLSHYLSRAGLPSDFDRQ